MRFPTGTLSAALLFSILTNLSGESVDFLSPREAGWTDWPGGYVSVSSTVDVPRIGADGDGDRKGGIPVLRLRRREEARRKASLLLMQILLGIQVDSDSAMRDLLPENSLLQERLGEIPFHFEVRSQQTGALHVRVELGYSFYGKNGLYAYLLGDPPEQELPEIRHSPGDEISALLIDVTEYPEFRPALLPKIYTDEGRMI